MKLCWFTLALVAVLSACNRGTVSTPPTAGPEAASLEPTAFYSFAGGSGDGAEPKSALFSAGAFLYGTTYWGGAHNAGTLFRINAGGQYHLLHNFGDFTEDGTHPIAAVSAAGGRLFGTTYRGGGPPHPLCPEGCGTVYTYDIANSRFRVIHDFKTFRTPTDTSRPWAGVLSLDGYLFGTTDPGKTSPHGHGAIFEMLPDGSQYKIIHSFTGKPDGDGSKGDLVPQGDGLLGTTERGGHDNTGVVFRFAFRGAQYGKVYNFVRSSENPAAGLFLYGDTYYGTTYWGGSANCGTIYSIGPRGFQLIYSFKCNPSDGAHPLSKLVAANGMLYGTTYWGGTDNDGTIFAIAPDGSTYQHFSFPRNGGRRPEGAHPQGGMTLHEGMLYGTTLFGGTSNKGTIFRVKPLAGNPTPSPSPSPSPTPTPVPTPTPTPTVSPVPVKFASIYSFTGGADGQHPRAGLIANAGVLLGTAYSGGQLGKGTIYTITPAGIVHTLYAFGHPQQGDSPAGELLAIGDDYFGTTVYGGSSVRQLCFPSGCGTLFKVNGHSHREQTLVNFDGSNTGQHPSGPLLLIGNTLIGTTFIGGVGGALVETNECPPDCSNNCPLGCGILYSVTTAGDNFLDLHHFIFNPDKAKYDGAFPKDGVTLVGNVLYGTTAGGGKPSNVTNHDGTLFKTDTAGGNYQIVHNFNDGGKGAFPEAGVIAIDGNLYGTSFKGGKNCGVRGCGVVFEIDLAGRRAEERVLHQFGGHPDGAYPESRLYYYKGMLYGTTTVGGASDLGTVFRISPSGTNYAIVHSFVGTDGAHPKARLTEFNGVLYGTTESGGVSNKGTVFRLTF